LSQIETQVSKDKDTDARNTVMTSSIHEKAALAVLSLCLHFALLVLSGCSQTAPPVTTPATGKVNTYFGGPFIVTTNPVGRSSSSFDHSANQIAVSAFVNTGQSLLVPTQVLSGSFTSANTGFLAVSENFATTNSGYGPQNPPLAGAWAVEIPGAGALANLLSVQTVQSGTGSIATIVTAAPAAMVDNTACPDFPGQTTFLYVNVPNPFTVSSIDTSNYGTVGIATQGSDVTFSATPYLIGHLPGTASVVTGGCSISTLGAVTSYPLNSYGQPSNVELISVAKSGLLASSFNSTGSVSTVGAFGGGNGVIGVQEPSSPVDVSAVIGEKYNGFVYAPNNAVTGTYDITVLASAFGNHAGDSPACSALQASLAANHGGGAGTVAALPSPNTIYGGEFLTVGSSSSVNDPSGALGSENCDVAIDLGTQDSTSSGTFSNATIFVGSNYPPFSASNPWNCFGTTSVCAVSFPAAAIVGQVQGQYVIFVAASANSIPPAQLPNNFSSRVAQPVGIYLFQRSQ
jgi:hypothetical protein